MSGHAQAPSSDPIERALAHAHGVLPDQGPIGVFIHHNTLHAFQHLPFHQAVQRGAAELGARPYLSLDEFRTALARGRITEEDLSAEIDRALGSERDAAVAPGLSTAALWHTLIASEADTHDAAGLEFTIRRGIATVCADGPLWAACLARVATGPRPAPTDTRRLDRHRHVLVALGAPDTDVDVHGELIRLGSGFLDQGQAHVVMPRRELGFLKAVARLYAEGASAPRACRGAEGDMRRVAADDRPARAVIESVLEDLGVADADVEPFLIATMLALPGWSGMFARLERHPEEHPGGPPASLIEFLAVRLLLERAALKNICRDRGLDIRWPSLRAAAPALAPRDVVLDASLLWHLSRGAGWTPTAVAHLDHLTLAAV